MSPALRSYNSRFAISQCGRVKRLHLLQTIINLCMALGFLAHGYATAEFEVTPERLGCYLPVRNHHTPPVSIRSLLLQTEHIDNPKGYGEGEDPRKYDKRLRGVSNAQAHRPHPIDSCIYSPWMYVAPRHIPSANSEYVA